MNTSRRSSKKMIAHVESLDERVVPAMLLPTGHAVVGPFIAGQTQSVNATLHPLVPGHSSHLSPFQLFGNGSHLFGDNAKFLP
jgi:hypothetical protein